MKKLLLLIFLIAALSAGAADVRQMDVAILGDSNTWIGGDDCSRPKGWNYWWTRAAAPASCRSYARSGATWTNIAATRRNLTENIEVLGANNVIYNQIMRLIEAADSGSQPEPHLIIIAAGTNDAWFARRRPGLFAAVADDIDTACVASLSPARVTSLAGSVMQGCALLARRFPAACIILLTPHQTTATSPASIAKVAELIEQCGGRLGLPVIRQDLGSGIVAADERKRFVNTTDGTHTSEAGARMVASFLQEQINKILQSIQ